MVRTVILEIVYCKCHACTRKIERALEKVHGVDDLGRWYGKDWVWVEGTANAQELKTRLETKMRKSVTIIEIKDGVDKPESASSRSATPPASPARYRTTSPPNYSPPPPPSYRQPTSSPPNYPPPPPPPSGGGYGYYDQYGGNGNYYDQYGGNGNYYDQYGGNGNYYDQYRANYENYVGNPRGPHYMVNDAPDFFSDENPNACSIQ